MCFHTRTQTLRIHGGGRAGEEAQGFQAAGNPGCPEHAVFQRRRPARSRGLGGCWPAALSGHKFYCRMNNAKLRVQQRMIKDGIQNKVVYEGTSADPTKKPGAETPSGPS
uniref:Uncharacterized protein n=1 Tax=Gasterosteus aculeatus aculeatus TaxID=481459 RepID=A0AAQ4Q418_GASAC